MSKEPDIGQTDKRENGALLAVVKHKSNIFLDGGASLYNLDWSCAVLSFSYFK